LHKFEIRLCNFSSTTPDTNKKKPCARNNWQWIQLKKYCSNHADAWPNRWKGHANNKKQQQEIAKRY